MVFPSDPGAAAPQRPLWVKLLLICLCLSGVLLCTLAALVARLIYAPLDITPFARRFMPISIERSFDPNIPAGRLLAKKLSIGWVGNLRNLPQGVGVWADDLIILGAHDEKLVTARHAYMRMLPSYLLKRRFRPVELIADHGTVNLRLFEDGDLDLDWPDARRHLYPIPPFSLQLLHELHIDHVTLSLSDSRSHKSVRVSEMDGFLRRVYTGHYSLAWDGALTGGVQANASPLGLISIKAQPVHDGSDWLWSLPLQNLSDLGVWAPPFLKWTLPAVLKGSVHVRDEGPALLKLPDSHVKFSYLSGDVKIGSGRVHQSGGPDVKIAHGSAAVSIVPTQSVSVLKGTLKGAGPAAARDHVEEGLSPARIRLSTMTLDVAAASGRVYSLFGNGCLELDQLIKPQHVVGSVHAALPRSIPMRDLADIWPVAFIHPVRTWVTENLVEGSARGLQANIRLESQKGLAHLDVAGLDGQWHVRNATLHWRRPVPPGIGVDADLYIKDKNALDIVFLRGRQLSRSHIQRQRPSNTACQNCKPSGAALTLNGGHMRIGGLFAETQQADLLLRLTGDLSGFLNIVSEPELKLLKASALPFSSPRGAVRANIAMQFPLEGADRPDAFKIKANAHFDHVSLQRLALGRAVTRARGDLHATEHGLKLNAVGCFAELPTTARVKINFSPNPPSGIAESFHTQTRVTQKALRRVWPDAASWVDGATIVSTQYASHPDGTAMLQTSLDLQNAAVDTPLWRKAHGDPANVRAKLLFRGRNLSEIPSIAARGRGLALQGWASILHGDVTGVVIEKLQLGANLGRARIIFPAQKQTPIYIHAALATIDVDPLIARLNLKPVKQKPPLASPLATYNPAFQTPWQVAITAQNVSIENETRYHALQATAAGRADSLERATLFVQEPSPISGILEPRVSGAHIHLAVQDLGRHVQYLTGYQRLHGGFTVLDAVTDAPCCQSFPNFRGNLDIRRFAFRHPPALLQILAHAALFDWGKTNAQRFELDRLHAGLTFDDTQINISDGYFGNRALSATLRGRIDLRQKRLDVKGTVVPVSGVNAILGRIPSIGWLFSPEKEGGLFAATYSASGPFDDLHIEANPFSVFLPGVIRSLNE